MPDNDYDAAFDAYQQKNKPATAAAMRAIGNYDANPEQAGQVLQFSKQTGVPAAVIDADPENFEREFKTQQAGYYARTNPHIAEYINSYPLASKVSNDDWPALDKLSEVLKPMWSSTVLGKTTDLIGAGIEGFSTAFGPGRPEDVWHEPSNTDIEFQKNWPIFYTNVKNTLAMFGIPMNVVNRTFAGILGAVGGVAGEAAGQVGLGEQNADRIKRDAMGMAEMYMIMMTGHHGALPTEASVKFWQDKQVQNLVDATKIAAPYIAEGKRPPPGLHPLIDDLYAEEAKADAKNLDDALRESKKTATGERAPDALAHFIRGQTNAEIGISADAIRRIYGEAQPEAEDGKLGWIPDIVSQLRSAEANGGDVKVPLADWLANVKPELAKELREDIRVRPGGMTLTEVALAKEQEEAYKGYHGTDREFQEFDPNAPSPRLAKHPDEMGVQFFSPDEMGASKYGSKIIPAQIKKGKTATFDATDLFLNDPSFREELRDLPSTRGEATSLEDYDTEVSRTLEEQKTHAETEERTRAGKEAEGEKYTPTPWKVSQRENIIAGVIQRAKKQGLDTAYVKNLDEGDQILVFNSKNVKRLDDVEAVRKSTALDPMFAKAEDVGRQLAILANETPIVPAPPKPGMVRLFHGGPEIGKGPEARWLTSVQEQAEKRYTTPRVRYAGIPGTRFLHYVDLPEDHPLLAKETTHEKSPYVPFQAPKEISDQLKPYYTRPDEKGEPAFAKPGDADYYLHEGRDYETEDYGRGIKAYRKLYYTENESKIIDVVDKTIERIAGKGVESRPRLGISYKDGTAHGAYLQFAEREPIVLWALTHDEPINTGGHEAMHHLRRMGFIRPEEWLTLKNAAVTNGWLDKYKIRENYSKAGPATQLEEGVAHAFGAWVQHKFELDAKSTVIFRRMQELAYSIKIALKRALGKEITWQDLFHEAEQGDIKSRTPSGPLDPKAFRPAFQKDDEIFERATDAGMTKEEYKLYLRNIEQRQKEDQAQIEKKALTEEKRKQGKEWKENEKRVEGEVRESIDNRPDFKAENFLRDGTLNGEKLGGVYRLDASKLTDEQKAMLPKEYYTNTYGVDPDKISGMFGYPTGKDMLDHLSQMIQDRTMSGMAPKEFKEFIVKDETARRMQAQYGDKEENALANAKAYALSETQIDLMDKEVRGLAEKAGVAHVPKGQLKEWVKQDFEQRKVGQVSSDDYFQAAGRAGRQARAADLKGKSLEAFHAAQRQQLGVLAAKEAMKFEKKMDQFKASMKRLGQRQVAGMELEGQPYLNQIHKIMIQIGQGIKRDANELEGEPALADFVESRTNPEGQYRRVMPVADFLKEGGPNKPINELSVADFYAVQDSIKTIEHNGRDEQKLYKQGEAEDLADLRQKAVEELETFVPNSRKVLEMSKTGPRKFIRTYISRLIHTETMLNRWSRGDSNGIFNKYIALDLAESANTERTMQRKYGKEYYELKDKEDLGELVRNTYIANQVTDTPITMTRGTFREMLSHIGNKSNFTKLYKGYGLKDPEAFMNWIKATAKPEDWKFVRNRAKIFNRLTMESDRLNMRQSGLPMEKLPLWDVDTSFTDADGVRQPGIGTVEGWYHPVIYDPQQPGSSKALMGEMNEDKYYRATTPRSYEKKRSNYYAPISFDPKFIKARMQQQIHDIAFRESLQNAGKFFYDKGIRRAIIKHSAFGPEMNENIPQYLNQVAFAQRFNSGESSTLAKASEFFRQNAMVTYVGLNLGTVAKHTPTAWVNSMREVGPANFLNSLRVLSTERPEEGVSNWRFAMENSEELQGRHQHWVENLGGAYEDIHADSKFGTYRGIARYYYSAPVATGDLISAVPTWLAAYDKAAKEAQEAGVEFNHGAAVALGNRAVRRAHGSTAITNRPLIMNDLSPWLTTLYGFFNNQFNRMVDLTWHAADTVKMGKEQGLQKALKQVPGLSGELFATMIFPALVEQMVSPLVTDKDSYLTAGAKTMLRFSASIIPFARDIAEFVLGGTDPSVGLIGSAIRPAYETYKNVRDEAVNGKDKAGLIIRHSMGAVGVATGLSTDQVGKLGQLSYGLAKGSERPKSFFGIDARKPSSFIEGPLGQEPESLMYGVRHGTVGKGRGR